MTASTDRWAEFDNMPSPSGRPRSLSGDYRHKTTRTSSETHRGRTTYNDQFPGLVLRFKEGQRVTVDVPNETDVPEQLHWHGQAIPGELLCNFQKIYREMSRTATSPQLR